MKMDEENKNEWLEKYLEGALEGNELALFQKEMETNRAFKETVETQELVHQRLQEYMDKQAMQGILKDIFIRDKSYFESLAKEAPPKVPTTDWRKIQRIGALVFLGCLLAWLFFFKLMYQQPQDKIVKENHDPKNTQDSNIKKDNNTLLIDSINKVQSQDPERQKTPQQEKKQPALSVVLDSIPELRYKKAMGFSGSVGTEQKKRLVLFYHFLPEDDLDASKKYYKFRDDTLRLYGLKDKNGMKLLFYEKNAQYKLFINPDTIPLSFKEKRWKLLYK
jgi:hypothetical protein